MYNYNYRENETFSHILIACNLKSLSTLLFYHKYLLFRYMTFIQMQRHKYHFLIVHYAFSFFHNINNFVLWYHVIPYIELLFSLYIFLICRIPCLLRQDLYLYNILSWCLRIFLSAEWWLGYSYLLLILYRNGSGFYFLNIYCFRWSIR